MEQNRRKYSESEIEAMKGQARRSGLSYNEAIEYIARKTGGRGTHIYSDTDVATIKEQNKRSEMNKSE